MTTPHDTVPSAVLCMILRTVLRSMLHVPCILITAAAVLAAGCGAPPPTPEAVVHIRPSAEHPRYWEIGGEPVVLIGGSKEDNLFQISDLEAHLDELVSAGGNYVRNTMSSRDSGNVWPFERQADGRYDLERPSTEYFDRFARLLDAASERGVVVQIELWDRFDYAREPWLSNPFRPANNINYTTDESGLADLYERHPGSNDNPFFRSVPAQEDNRLLLRYQQDHIDRILEISLAHPYVLYTMDNETSADPEWGEYWAAYVQQQAEAAGVTVYATEMWDAWDLKDEQHRRTLDRPDLYDFADVSQNNHNTGQEHWDNLQWVRRYTASNPRPLNNVKIYGADTGRYGTSRDGTERFWRSVIGGAATARFHRPESGLGLGDTARTHLSSARLFLDAFSMFDALPDSSSHLLEGRDPNEAYLTRVDDDRYAVYFPDGGRVDLDLSGVSGSFGLRWLDVEGSRWIAPTPVVAGGRTALVTPGTGHWVAVLTRP